MSLRGRREKDEEERWCFEGVNEVVREVALVVALVVVEMAAAVVVVEREKSFDMVVDAVKAMAVVGGCGWLEWRERERERESEVS